MNHRLLLKFALYTLISLAGLSFGSQSKASALICKVLSPAIESSPPSNNDCLTNGQSQSNDFSGLSASSSSNTLKRQFITKMTSFESGQHLQYVGASYIEARIKGNSGMFWQDRLNLNDVTLSIDQNYSYSSNSGYNPYTNLGSGSVQVIDSDSGTAPALVFKVEGVVRFVIKLNCGNPLDDMTLPAPPIIRGYKVDESNSINGLYSLDLVNATNSVPASDINQPFNFSIEKNPSAASTTISVADATPGWKVLGSTYIACNTANLASQNCPFVDLSDTRLTPKLLNFMAGNSRSIPVRPGYIYDMRWVYQKVKEVTITGYKIDETGSRIGAYSSDWIRAINGSYNRPDNGQPYNISIPSGNINITPANNIKKWNVKGYCLGVSCTTASSLVNTAPITANPGDVIYMNWIYKSTSICTVFCGPINMCPASNVPNPATVSVSLPDLTLTTPAPSASTTTPNNLYYQNTSLNKTNVISVQDISSGGNKLLSIVNLKSVASANPALVDYTPFVDGYPYDNNQASVSYTYDYTITPWVSSSTPDSYTCADKSTPDAAHMCTAYTDVKTTTTTQVAAPSTTTHCSSNTVGTWNGTDCGTYGVTSTAYSCPASIGGGTINLTNTWCDNSYILPAYDNWTCSNPTSATRANGKTCLSANRIHSWTCNLPLGPGGSLVPPANTSCKISSGYTPKAVTTTVQKAYPNPAAVTVYSSCVLPDTAVSGDATKCNHTTTTTVSTANYTPATAWYNYSKKSSYTQTASNTVNGLPMTPCFSRGFSVSDVSAASANVSFNDNENPTSVNAGGYTASVKFYYTNRDPTQGLRQPMAAKLTYGYKLSPIACSNSDVPFTITGGFGPSGPSSYAIPSAGCSVSVPPLSVGSTACVSYSVSPTGSTAGPDGSVGSSGGSLSSSYQCSGPVVNKPYFKVFGSDISVGGGFYDIVNGNKCTSSNSSIFGWNTGTNSVYNSQYAGAGAQFLLSSMGSLSGAASNQNNINSFPRSAFVVGNPNPDPVGLSLSNVGANAASNLFGTTLGTANCMADYYSSRPTTAQPVGSTSLSGSDGAYNMAGGSTINPSNIGPSNVPGQARRITVYVSGDLYIAGDINYVGGFSSINDIPSLIIIVKDGNIYIDKSVSNLTGIFVAQSTISNKGYIYDCASGFAAIANNQLYDNCGKRLTVNGSFIANKVVLNRTGNATNDKLSSSLRRAAASENNTNTNATEIFNYGPAFWINTALPITGSAGTTSAGYDSIINLPPIL